MSEAYLWSDGIYRTNPEPNEENARLHGIIKNLEKALEEIARAGIIGHSTGKYSLVAEMCAETAQEALKALRSGQ